MGFTILISFFKTNSQPLSSIQRYMSKTAETFCFFTFHHRPESHWLGSTQTLTRTMYCWTNSLYAKHIRKTLIRKAYTQKRMCVHFRIENIACFYMNRGGFLITACIWWAKHIQRMLFIFLNHRQCGSCGLFFLDTLLSVYHPLTQTNLALECSYNRVKKRRPWWEAAFCGVSSGFTRYL